MGDEFEIVDKPPDICRTDKSRFVRAVYDKALTVAKEGRGVRLRIETMRERDNFRNSIQRIGRLRGTKVRVLSSAGGQVTVWIDS